MSLQNETVELKVVAALDSVRFDFMTSRIYFARLQVRDLRAELVVELPGGGGVGGSGDGTDVAGRINQPGWFGIGSEDLLGGSEKDVGKILGPLLGSGIATSAD